MHSAKHVWLGNELLYAVGGIGLREIQENLKARHGAGIRSHGPARGLGTGQCGAARPPQRQETVRRDNDRLFKKYNAEADTYLTGYTN